MKFLRQEKLNPGTVVDHYEKHWRGHRVRVEFQYIPDDDTPWDGDEPLDPDFECYGVVVKAHLFKKEGSASVWGNWIDPAHEGRSGTNFLFHQAEGLLEEALDDLGQKIAGHSCKNKVCIVQGVLEA